jgi:hypothetical protein
MMLRVINTEIPDFNQLGLLRVLKGVVMTKRGLTIFGQIDFARRDDRLSQPNRLRPHHDHRGSDQVRAQSQELR